MVDGRLLWLKVVVGASSVVFVVEGDSHSSGNLVESRLIYKLFFSLPPQNRLQKRERE